MKVEEKRMHSSIQHYIRQTDCDQWSDSRPNRFIHRRKALLYTLNGKLGGVHSGFERFWGGTFLLLGIEALFSDYLAYRIVTLLTASNTEKKVATDGKCSF